MKIPPKHLGFLAEISSSQAYFRSSRAAIHRKLKPAAHRRGRKAPAFNGQVSVVSLTFSNESMVLNLIDCEGCVWGAHEPASMAAPSFQLQLTLAQTSHCTISLRIIRFWGSINLNHVWAIYPNKQPNTQNQVTLTYRTWDSYSARQTTKWQGNSTFKTHVSSPRHLIPGQFCSRDKATEQCPGSASPWTIWLRVMDSLDAQPDDGSFIKG